MRTYTPDTDERPDDPVCRFCGAGPRALRTIEVETSWRDVNWERGAEGWARGDEWGDDEDVQDTSSVGIACAECYTTRVDPDELIVTREAYHEGHPVRTWRVERERIVTPAQYEHVTNPDPEHPHSYSVTSTKLSDDVRERELVEVLARDPREANAAMYEPVPDAYPWCPTYPYRPGSKPPELVHLPYCALPADHDGTCDPGNPEIAAAMAEA